MSVRSRLIVNHSGFPAPLLNAIEDRGLNLVWDRWDPSSSDLNGALGCVIWFYEGMRSPIKVWQLARRLRRWGVPLFAWNQDAPHYLNRASWRLDWYNRARLLDIYATHTLIDSRVFSDAHIYFPNTADVARYNLDGTSLESLTDESSYRYDVSFFGAMDGMRYKEMVARQHFFEELGSRLRARGLRFLFCEAANLSIPEQVALIRQTRININFGASCDYGASVASGLPERCYGVPACGGFLLCDKRTHARDDFTPGDNWAEFDGLDDCVTQIEFWLANFAAARDLAERCHTHVMGHHTYAHRAETLHNALQAWHAGKRGRLS